MTIDMSISNKVNFRDFKLQADHEILAGTVVEPSYFNALLFKDNFADDVAVYVMLHLLYNAT